MSDEVDEGRRLVLALPMLELGAAALLLATVADRASLIVLIDGELVRIPAFQIQGGAVLPVVATINRALRAEADPWTTAAWWASPRPDLGDRAPLEVLGGPDEASLFAALPRRRFGGMRGQLGELLGAFDPTDPLALGGGSNIGDPEVMRGARRGPYKGEW